MKNIVLVLIFLLVCGNANTQNTKKKNTRLERATPTLASNKTVDRPKLVVGIVVDQMRPDYLSRFYEKFSERGFKRLMNEGFQVKNMHYDYIPTFTGPGHASIYTGTTPAMHGIIANYWHDKTRNTGMYCVEDRDQVSIGAEPSSKGQMSPKNLIPTTITDELRGYFNYESKVIGMSIKDRGAILPAGHTGNAAYWFDYNAGRFISSTYYMESLPTWVEDFSNKHTIDSYIKDGWNTMKACHHYDACGMDESPFENPTGADGDSSFPHTLDLANSDIPTKSYFFTRTPYGDRILGDLAIAAIESEQMGEDDICDFLAVSFSSPDIIGHAYGPSSVEIEDTYLRLDETIADILDKLDASVGRGEYLVFLTADHAVAEIPNKLIEQKIPVGYFNTQELSDALNATLTERFKVDTLISNISNEQIFLDQKLIRDHKLNKSELIDLVVDELMLVPGMARAFSGKDLLSNQSSVRQVSLLQKGYNQKRSGDILYQLDPGWINYMEFGTTHGSGYNYDTHVPMLWYGKGISRGATVAPYDIADIAVTLAFLLDITLPNAASGKPILELFEK